MTDRYLRGDVYADYDVLQRHLSPDAEMFGANGAVEVGVLVCQPVHLLRGGEGSLWLPAASRVYVCGYEKYWPAAMCNFKQP